MRDSDEQLKRGTGAVSGLIISFVKILIVFVITMAFVFYLVEPPGTRSFLSGTAQSDTIVRTVDPI